ncbi:DUF362 domain-containing protein [Myxococcota bacterium]
MVALISRRDALDRLVLGSTALASAGALTWWRFEPATGLSSGPRSEGQVRSYEVRSPATGPVMAIAKSSREPAILTRRAVDALGGIARFVSRDDVVAIKPNIGWDRLPVHAANTNPHVVAELVRMCFEAGAKRVVVADVSCNEPNRSFQRSGIWRAAHSAGATVILPSPHRFRMLRMQGELLDEWPIFIPLVDADKVINVPIAKHHNLSRYSGAMKNWYGLLGGRRNRLHQNIDVSIADLATFMRPTLTLLDATRILVRNGPQGGDLDDTRDAHQVIASLDQVAVDAYGARLIGERPENIGYLRLAQERGLGTFQLQRVDSVEV